MPLLYEINTRAWLRDLSDRAGKPVRLGDVPDSEIERWNDLGFSDIWLMGVWGIGQGAREIALEQWRTDWQNEIPSDENDVQGSPFAIADYLIDPSIATLGEFLAFKQKINQKGMGLIVDIIPNHFSLDAEPAARYPSYFVQGRPGTPGTFTRKTKFGKKTFAHGRDPNFPPWTDTVQVDHRNGNAQEVLANIMLLQARLSDGFRCDMAMLVLPEIFAKTWEAFPPAVQEPARFDFWANIWERIGAQNPYFVSIAEVYWDLEERLQREGFDFTYHKPVYDLVMRGDYAGLQALVLQRSPEVLARCVHFLENHDEPRIASLLPWNRHKTAALLLLTLPGMPLLHDGQLEGRKGFARIQMSKRLPEEPDETVRAFYEELLRVRKTSLINDGDGRVMRPMPLADKGGSQNLIVTRWQGKGSEVDLAVVNPGAKLARCLLEIEMPAATPRLLFATTEKAPPAVQVVDGKVVIEIEGESGQIVRLTASG